MKFLFQLLFLDICSDQLQSIIHLRGTNIGYSGTQEVRYGTSPCGVGTPKREASDMSRMVLTWSSGEQRPKIQAPRLYTFSWYGRVSRGGRALIVQSYHLFHHVPSDGPLSTS